MRYKIPVIEAEIGLVVECAESGFCGAVIGFEHGAVTLEDRFGKLRHFPLTPAAFLVDGAVTTLVRPTTTRRPLQRTASGSVALPSARAQVARASRIWVEGIHDAELIERVWGHDLRGEAIVVEPMHGADDLREAVVAFAPSGDRRLGILLDHLLLGIGSPKLAPGSKPASFTAGTKEARLASTVDSAHVLIAGHPYVDVWQAVKPARLGLREWPVIPPGRPWKEGICEALGVADPREFWPRLLSRVDSYRDLETPLVNSVERLIDFVSSPQESG